VAYIKSHVITSSVSIKVIFLKKRIVRKAKIKNVRTAKGPVESSYKMKPRLKGEDTDLEVLIIFWYKL
jgi:hypothetical protein